MAPSQSVPTQTAPCNLPARSTGRGKREATNWTGEIMSPLKSTGSRRLRPRILKTRSASTKRSSRPMKKMAFFEPFALEVHRHELCLFVVDVAQRELADRRGEVELPEDRERLVALLPTVPEDVRRQQALLDHRLHGERAGQLVAVHGAVVAVQNRERPDGVELVVEGELLVEVGGARDVARPAGAHVEVVPPGLQAGLHDREVPGRGQGAVS